jgi:hypothetical protein
MNENPDDPTRAMRDRFAAAAAKLGTPIPPSVEEIQRLGLKRRRRRLGMAAAVTSAAAAVVAIALVTSVFGTSADEVRPATSRTPVVTPNAGTPTPTPSALRSAVESPSPSAGLANAPASSAVPSTAVDGFGTFVTPGPIWQTGMGVDGVSLYSSSTGQLVRTLAMGHEFLPIQPVGHAQVGQWVYFVQTSMPFDQAKPVGPPQLMRVLRGGGTPELLASLTDTKCGGTSCFALTNDATRIAYVTADGYGLGRTIHVRDMTNKASAAVSIALATLEQPIGWLPDDHTLVLESKTTIEEINVDEPGAKPVVVSRFDAASATCAASSSSSEPAATLDDGTVVVVGGGCAGQELLIERITPDHVVHSISLPQYSTWTVSALHVADGLTPTIILEASPPNPSPTCFYPPVDLVQVQDDQARILATPPTSPTPPSCSTG